MPRCGVCSHLTADGQRKEWEGRGGGKFAPHKLSQSVIYMVPSIASVPRSQVFKIASLFCNWVVDPNPVRMSSVFPNKFNSLYTLFFIR